MLEAAAMTIIGVNERSADEMKHDRSVSVADDRMHQLQHHQLLRRPQRVQL
ncbi:MAG: hypothetical protein JNL58_26945 [Planctomyces sp.]|nr:hypothetical protein [Planctomyces sp.]